MGNSNCCECSKSKDDSYLAPDDDESIPLVVKHNNHNNKTHEIDFGLASGIFYWRGTVLSRIWPTVLAFMIYAWLIVYIPPEFVMSTGTVKEKITQLFDTCHY